MRVSGENSDSTQTDGMSVPGRKTGPILGPGFAAGQWSEFSDPDGAPMSIGHLDPGAPDVFSALARFAGSVPAGGAVVGYVGYEAAVALEPSLRLAPPEDGFPLLWARRYKSVTHTASAPLETTPALPPDPIDWEVEDAIGPASYHERVRLVQNAIRRGDIYQANISRPVTAQAAWRDGIAQGLARRAFAAHPARYAAYLPLGDNRTVLSLSPELLLSVSGRQALAEPIKGTRPRRSDPVEDAAMASELLADEKDRAENIMITDLLRNDLSKVCEDHSVIEGPVCELRTLAYVHHLASRVSGTLRPEKSPVDALAACFPCGSITGAPKWRAMEVVSAIEGGPRGPYCGTIFAIWPDGRAVFSVAIRTGTLHRRNAQAILRMAFGGGVTTLSTPEAEYDETVHKSAPFTDIIS